MPKSASDTNTGLTTISSCTSFPSSDCDSDKKKSGLLDSNPFFNFMKEYRQKHPEKSSKEICVDGGKKWRRMNEKDRARYKPEGLKNTF